MPIETIQRTFETLVQNLPELIVNTKPNPLILGAGATIIGLLFTLFQGEDKDLLLISKELEKMDTNDYSINPIVRKEELVEIISSVIFSFGILVSLILLMIIVLFVKTFWPGKDKLFEKKLEVHQKKLKDIQIVVESILKDGETYKGADLNLLKEEIELGRISFNDLITNKSLELDTKISQAKSHVENLKDNIHADLRKAKSYTDKIPVVHEVIKRLKNDFMEASKLASNLKEEMKSFTSQIESDLSNSKSKIDEFHLELENRMEFKEIEIYKCNALLLNSQILFDASLSKFEVVENSFKTLLNSESSVDKDLNELNLLDSQKRLEKCLKIAIEVRRTLQSSENFDDKNSRLSVDFDKCDFPFAESPKLDPVFKNATNSVLIDLRNRLSSIELKISKQDKKIEKNNVTFKSAISKSKNNLREYKEYNEEWVIAWISVIYSLFNSSFIYLQGQIFGTEKFESLNVFGEASSHTKDNDQFLKSYVNHCKETCLKTLKEVSLLTFEFYLVQKDPNKTADSILGICERKIIFEVDSLFSYFEQTIKNTEIPPEEAIKLTNMVFHFKNTLKNDLVENASRFNLLFKQNLNDFYIIHDTLKNLIKEEEIAKKNIENNKRRDDSVVEISDSSNSLISVTSGNSSNNEDTSMSFSSMNNVFGVNSFKPFKLVQKNNAS